MTTTTIDVDGCKLAVPTLSALIAALRGRNGGLRHSKPGENGFAQYVWRMARFDAGHDMTMPFNCFFDLQSEVERQTGTKYNHDCPVDVIGIINPAGKALLNALDVLADLVCDALGENKMKAAARWGAAMGW